jgi:Glycosyl transferases group 1
LTSDYEGFPNVVLEAMAARLPVISTPAGDAGLIVQDGLTGYVVEYDDINKMAERMIQLARSAALRRSLGEAGRRRVEQEYSHESLTVCLAGVFHRFARQYGRSSLCGLLERGGFAAGTLDLRSSKSQTPSSSEIPIARLHSRGLHLGT